MARIPTALIPPPHGREIPPHDYGLDEKVETAAVLLGTMLPSQVAQRLVRQYGCVYASAYAYIAQARAFIAGLDRRGHGEWFDDVSASLWAIVKNPAAGFTDKIAAMKLLVGMRGLRREPPRAKDDEAPMYDREE